MHACSAEEEDKERDFAIEAPLSGLRKLGIITRGSQGALYAARERLPSGEKRVVAVKRLYPRENPYGEAGVDACTIREPALLHHVGRMVKAESMLPPSVASSSASLMVLDDTASVVQLFHVREAPFEEICLVLEYCPSDLHHLCFPACEREEEGDFSDESSGEGMYFDSYDVGSEEEGDGLFGKLDFTEEGDGEVNERVHHEGGTASYVLGDGPVVAHQPQPSGFGERNEDEAPQLQRCDLLSQLPLLRYLMRRVLRIFVFLHDVCHICHRDAKLSNILISRSGGLRLCDFGSAYLMEPSLTDPATAVDNPNPLTPTTMRSTRVYTAPECILNQSYSNSMDLWSIGVIFAELVLQRPLFTGMSELAVLSEIFDLLAAPEEKRRVEGSFIVQGKDEASLSQLISPFLPAEGIAFLSGFLQLDPEKRWTAQQAIHHSFLTFPGWELDDEEGAALWKRKLALA